MARYGKESQGVRHTDDKSGTIEIKEEVTREIADVQNAIAEGRSTLDLNDRINDMYRALADSVIFVRIAQAQMYRLISGLASSLDGTEYTYNGEPRNDYKEQVMGRADYYGRV